MKVFFFYIRTSQGLLNVVTMPAQADDHTDNPENYFGQRLRMKVPQPEVAAGWPFACMYPICEGIHAAWGDTDEAV